MNPNEVQFPTREDKNVRDYGHFEVSMHEDSDGVKRSVLRRPGTTGKEGILPRDIPMSGDAFAKLKRARD